MQIVIETTVAENYIRVMERFDKTLFTALTPPGATVNIVRFEGSQKGNIVHIQLSLKGYFAQEWISEITDMGETAERVWFTDEGKVLPFFLSYWKHQHIVKNNTSHAVIVDWIEFRTPFRVMDFLLYPIMYLQFYYRKPIYRRFFGKWNT